MNRELVAAALRDEFEREEQSGFARLSKVPDTLILRFLEHYRTLDPGEAALLKAALALRGAAWFLPPDPHLLGLQTLDPVLERCHNAMQRLGAEWRFNSLK